MLSLEFYKINYTVHS